MNRYSVNKTDSSPAYLQLYRQIRHDITEGHYRFGDRLPSKRMLAEDTGTSVITTNHALELLMEEGYIEARERSGFFVVYQADVTMPVSEAGLSPVSTAVRSDAPPLHTDEISPRADIRHALAESFPFATYAKTMRRVLTIYGDQILIKSPNFGIPKLRETLAQYLARSRGIVVHPDQIIIGSGSEYMYSLIVQMLGRNELYGIEDPSYQQIRKVYEANGASVDLLKMGTTGITSEALSSTRARILHITPFHSFPTGITADASKRAEYIRWATAHHAMIIEDDMDSEFTMSTKAEDTIFSLEPNHTVIYLNTFSRTIAPSLRAGYMVLPKELSTALKQSISFYSCTVPVYDQYVIAEFIQSGEFERHINRVRRLLRKKK